MERVAALISKLQEQNQQGADAGKLMVIAQMLINELQRNNNGSAANTSKKVSVVMPAARAVAGNASNGNATFNDEDIAVLAPPKMVEPVQAKVEEPKPQPVEVKHAEPKPQPVEVKQAEPKREANEPEEKQPEETNKWRFDPLKDIPTLAHQNKEVFEVNESMADKEQSLNERLRVEKIELGNSLKEAPIKDLRKAIGINDRYLFINELFRGDETMYERSIKTINSFNILAEAEYWIQRELKLKIGWKENEVVKHFDQLVRRRFS